MIVEMQLDENSTLYADVNEEDTSFSHELGVQRSKDLDVKSIWIKTIIGGFETTVKPATQFDIDYFTGKVKEKYWYDRAG